MAIKEAPELVRKLEADGDTLQLVIDYDTMNMAANIGNIVQAARTWVSQAKTDLSSTHIADVLDELDLHQLLCIVIKLVYQKKTRKAILKAVLIEQDVMGELRIFINRYRSDL